MSLSRTDILNALAGLGEYLVEEPPELRERIRSARSRNPWYTEENCRLAIRSVAEHYLDADRLERWIRESALSTERNSGTPKAVGVVAAGNLPLVGMHDVISVLVSGHQLLLKVSSKDDVLLPFLLERLTAGHSGMSQRIRTVDRLSDFDAVIATGSNNSARYFEYYFGKVPNIIRKNRNSVAVLRGDETEEDLKGLAADVFSYFGLGCRNVSKLYIPEDFDIDRLKGPFEAWKAVFDHNQYRNNLDYHRTILLMNNIPFHDIDIINLTHNPSVASPIANLHYEWYEDEAALEERLLFDRRQVQCIAGNVPSVCTVGFGETQTPELWDYADGVNTLAFLASLN